WPMCPSSSAEPRRSWPSRSKRIKNNAKAQPNQRTGLQMVLGHLVLVVEERFRARFPRPRDDITALALENVHLLGEGHYDAPTGVRVGAARFRRMNLVSAILALTTALSWPDR